MADLIPDPDAFEHAFDKFEVLIAMSYLKAGARGMPLGEFAYRGQRAMVGSGVPEHLEAEITREGESWAPIADGVFDSLDDATGLMAALKERLSRFQFF